MKLINWILVLSSFSFLKAYNPPNPDWLIDTTEYSSKCQPIDESKLELTNGLIGRVFSLSPDFATIAYYENHTAKASILRALYPEAVVSLDNKQYFVGGLNSSMTRAYFNFTAFDMDHHAFENAFHFSSYKVLQPAAPYPYTPARHAPKDIAWPPKGVRLDVKFLAPVNAPSEHKQLSITVHYEIYDNIPTMTKWVTVEKIPELPLPNVSVQILSVELLAVNQPWAKLNQTVDRAYTPFNSNQGFEWLYVETTWAHGTEIIWTTETPVNNGWTGTTEPVVNVTYSTYYPMPINAVIVLESFRVVETAIGSSDPERQMLSRHRAFRTLAPQVQENPIFFNSIYHDSAHVRALLDQMHEAGFELLIYGFNSGIRMESNNETFIQQIKKDVDYARSKGIEVGGYDLIVWTREPPEEYYRRVDPTTGSPTHDACIASGWYDQLHDNVINFMKRTGMTSVETDGPYNGFPCASRNHSYHKSLDDSVYQQTRYQNALYRAFRQENFYIHQPDYYFYQGANKRPMGYGNRQFQDNPPWRDLSVSRQIVHDNLYHKTNVMVWMAVPLDEGIPKSDFEPLSTHLQAYEFALGMYFGAGITSTYQGFRLWDSPESKALVIKWVSFFKKHRSILISDVMHIKRPDMLGLDGFVHVNPKLEEKALAMVFNPTDWVISQSWVIPLYYAGIKTDSVFVSEQDAASTKMKLSAFKQLAVNVKLQPKSVSWFVIREAS